MKNELQIGVFICDCGGEISNALNVDEIMHKVSRMPDIALMKRVPYGCSPDGEEVIQQGIRGEPLNRVILLGCSPRIMEKKFQKVCSEAGLNPSLLEIVNLRDQCTWVHQNEPSIANGKAWDLTKMAITRVRHLTPVDTLKAKIHPEVVVIGGGIAGMTAAISLADRGIKVRLVEKEEDLGGYTRKLNHLMSSMENSTETARILAEQVRRSENIDVLTKSELIAISGSYGNYEIELKVEDKSQKILCGAVILAMGAQELKPEGYYGYGENDKVITQFELEQKLAQDPTLVDLDNIVMIQCVGARNEKRPYCGRICCMTAVHNAIQLKKKKPALNITILYRDIPSEPGPDRNTLNKADELGVKLLRFSENDPPCVNSSVVSGQSFEGQPFELPYDLAVLSTPMIPYESSRTLAHAFRIPVDQFGFIPDTLPNLKPHQYTEPCVHVVGSAHWPCTVSEATYQAYGRAAHIASLIKKQEVFSTRAITSVDFDTCRGCSTCLEWCPFDVPVITNGTGGVLVSHIDPFLCKGCGSCVVHCPSGAATLQNLEDETLYSTIEAALINREWSSVKTIAFLCEWSGYAAADLAGISRRNLPGEVIPIRIPCAGRVSTGLILHAFTFGADGVLICACEEGDCHYLSGNTNCAAVAIDTENILGLLGIEKERFQMAHVSAVDFEAFSKTLEDFIATIKKLEPSVFRLTYAEEEL